MFYLPLSCRESSGLPLNISRYVSTTQGVETLPPPSSSMPLSPSGQCGNPSKIPTFIHPSDLLTTALPRSHPHLPHPTSLVGSWTCQAAMSSISLGKGSTPRAWSACFLARPAGAGLGSPCHGGRDVQAF